MKTKKNPPYNPLSEYVHRLQTGEALLKDSSENVLEVVGILKSYGVVLDAYSKNLIYIAEHQFLVFFPFFKYFDGDISFAKLFRHLFHDRINFEYAEYCMKTMMWHGGGGLDIYLDTKEFQDRAKAVIAAKFKYNPLMLGLNELFPEFLIEQLRVSAYYTGLGQFWRIMADMFLSLSDRYDNGEIKSIPQVVEHIKLALVADAITPITYSVKIGDKVYDLIPKSVGLTFLADTAIPYVEAVFFRGTPFLGTVSLNAQAYQVPPDLSRFQYGALYADPLPIGGAGIPPTLLMQDMRHYLPEYLHNIYRRSLRCEDDLRVQICMSFQKSMFCVTTAAILGLLPYSLDTQDLSEQKNNQVYLEKWVSRLENSRLLEVNK
ncbi:CO2 hydration protein [Dolichospermum sp. ST_sed1]|nr:CO2 hydration protein [Dolichospermum sp. ST_sed1]MDD1428904.1 CO2 hydration protein [Dolichospermum sp. ST_sed9]MDD1432617.1 CO2 hydration protein [Dolichospermum sp. ST_sed6]MDD1437553.1 CO2 hydration protein [Dolichospermum sp. ST_sed10]MDD1440297.1 CO2 hydration protein [Dolichospermum sp. ST_sed3]MDD1447756.1 CO2 hydration protein [Dolichospermum sp. ST_sed8]MDD1456134.1 CO2 hydration protein [Dolichospermum sp. ST_sed7]MDD1460682.1 CO2 hydration protein [Dolichospermum sp. ST_sed2]